MDKRVLITGITGFLGSHIAENLLASNFQVIGLKRKDSSIWRCEGFKNKVIWIDIDEDYQGKISEIKFDVFIHAAWIGVKSNERDDRDLQAKNITFLEELLQITNANKIIFLGSQAEYGTINGVVSEDEECKTTTAYGKAKLACLDTLKDHANSHNINWVWLRLFSLFGEKEDENWLIPALVKKMKIENEMDFTLAEQKYAYLYVKDFVDIIYKVITMPIESGIYNVSSTYVIKIKMLIEKIRDNINPYFKLNFGALDYRENQSMHIEGSIEKLSSQIGEIKLTDFDLALGHTIDYYSK